MDWGHRSSVSRMIFESDDEYTQNRTEKAPMKLESADDDNESEDEDISRRIKKASIKMEPVDNDNDSTLDLYPEKHYQESITRETIDISDDDETLVDDNHRSKPTSKSSRPIVYRVRVMCQSIETQTEISRNDAETTTDDFETYLNNIKYNKSPETRQVNDERSTVKYNTTKAIICGDGTSGTKSGQANRENLLNRSNIEKVTEGNVTISFCNSAMRDHNENGGINTLQVNEYRDIQYKGEPKKKKETKSKIGNTYYRCNICSCFYSYYSAFQKHVQSIHKKKKIPCVPLEAFEAQCKFCKFQSISTYNYNNHIRIKHMKKFNKSRVTVTNPADTKVLDLPSTSKVQVLDITTSKEKAITKPPMPSKIKEKKCKEKIIPKSVLYKCSNCSTHFLSYNNAAKHTEKCKNGDHKNKQIIVACPICQRNFCNQTIESHYVQHKHTSSFTTHVLNEKIMDRYLYKCPTCQVCFNEKKFKSHRNKKMCLTNKIYRNMDCNRCVLKIAEECYLDHERLHQAWKYVQNHFTVIEVLIINSNLP